MSADNWTQCPKCRKNEKDRLFALLKKVDQSYGKVPVEEYIAARDAANDQVSRNVSDHEDNTLREDFEISMDEDGLFEISYRSSCNACGFSFDFKHSEKAKL